MNHTLTLALMKTTTDLVVDVQGGLEGLGHVHSITIVLTTSLPQAHVETQRIALSVKE